jgi:Fe-S-cluster containining protein
LPSPDPPLDLTPEVLPDGTRVLQFEDYTFSFRCQQSGRCCAGPEEGIVSVNEDEIAALAERLNMTVDAFREQYTRRVGIQSVSLIEKANRDCVFQDAVDRTCTVYEQRPTQCRTYPFWPEFATSVEGWREVMRDCPGTSMRRTLSPADKADLYAELEEIYRDIDAAIGVHTPICEQSGVCCRFAESEHRLYTSDVEFMYLSDHVDMTVPVPEADVCPFMHEKMCTVRDHRMVGCRIYYCDPSFSGTMEALYEEFHARVKALTTRFGLEWNYSDFMTRMRQGSFPV